MAPSPSSSSQHFAINSFLVVTSLHIHLAPHDVGDPLLVGPAVRHQEVQLVAHLVVVVVMEVEVAAPTRMTLLLAPRSPRSPGQTEPGKSRRSTTTSTSASTPRRCAIALGHRSVQGDMMVYG